MGEVVLGLSITVHWAAGVYKVWRMIISSSGLIIAVGVVLDTMKQLEAQLRMRHYEGFIK